MALTIVTNDTTTALVTSAVTGVFDHRKMLYCIGRGNTDTDISFLALMGDGDANTNPVYLYPADNEAAIHTPTQTRP